METFNEWLKGRKARRPAKPRPPSVKNKTIDAFIKSVDGLKRDMDELDALEKKAKPKSVPVQKDDKPAIDSFKSYKDKRDAADADDEPDDEIEDGGEAGADPDDVPGVDADSDGERLRRGSDGEVPGRPPARGGKPNRPADLAGRRLAGR